MTHKTYPTIQTPAIQDEPTLLFESVRVNLNHVDLAQALRLHFSVKSAIASVVKVDSLGLVEEIGLWRIWCPIGFFYTQYRPMVSRSRGWSSRFVVGVVDWFICVWSLFGRLCPLMILAGLWYRFCSCLVSMCDLGLCLCLVSISVRTYVNHVRNICQYRID